MLDGRDRGERNAEAWQQVSLAFASTIALGAQRLASYIQGQLSRHLGFAQRPLLPMWMPDHRTLTSSRWAERLVSKIYGTIQSLPGMHHLTPPLSVEPSSFVWSRPSWVALAMPEGSEYIDTEQEPGFEAAPSRADNATTHRPAPRGTDSQGHAVSSPYVDIASQSDRPRVRASSFAPHLSPPNALPQRMELPAEPDATGQGSSPYLTQPGPIGLEASTLSPVVDTTVPSYYGESTVIRPYDRPRQSLLRQVLTQRASLTARTIDTLPRVKKVIAFVDRLLTAPAEPPRGQGLRPLTVSAAATDVHPLVAVEEAALTATGQVGPEWNEKRIEPLLAKTVPARATAPGHLPAMSGRQQFSAWLHGRRYPAKGDWFLEPAYPDTEAEEQAGLPGPLSDGPQFGAVEKVPLYQEFIFPSLPVVPPTSPEETALQALQPVATQEPMPSQHLQPSLGPRVPVTSSRSSSRTQPTTIMAGVQPAVSAPPSQPLHGATVAPGLAMAPLGRPTAQGQPVTETATSDESTEEATEVNLERLARDVYTVLRRRLAWEMESRLRVRA